jgi:hypothetical protein
LIVFINLFGTDLYHNDSEHYTNTKRYKKHSGSHVMIVMWEVKLLFIFWGDHLYPW